MNIPSYLPAPPRRFLTGSAGYAKLSAALDRAQAAADAVDGNAIREAVSKAFRPIAERLAMDEKAQGVTVHHSSLPNVPGPVPPTDRTAYRLPTSDGRKPDPQGDVARGYHPPKTEETSNE